MSCCILKCEVGSRKSEVGSRKSEVGSRNSEVGSRNSEVGSRKSEVALLGHRTFLYVARAFKARVKAVRKTLYMYCLNRLLHSQLAAAVVQLLSVILMLHAAQL